MSIAVFSSPGWRLQMSYLVSQTVQNPINKRTAESELSVLVDVQLSGLTCRPPLFGQRRRPSSDWGVAGGVQQRRPASGCGSAHSAHPGQQTSRSAPAGQTANIWWHLMITTVWTGVHMTSLLRNQRVHDTHMYHVAPVPPPHTFFFFQFLDLLLHNYSSQVDENPLTDSLPFMSKWSITNAKKNSFFSHVLVYWY